MNDISRDEWLELRDDVTAVRTMLDGMLSTIDDHETRIRETEKWKWGMPVSVIAALAVFFGAK